MADDFKAQRVGTLQLRLPDGNGGYERHNLGAVLTTRFEGNYRVILEVDTDEKNEDGYTIRDRIVAVKPKSAKKGIDISEGFLHLNAWKDMPKRPPRDDD